jgi:DNA gyrase/topoisomerase IV subunit A
LRAATLARICRVEGGYARPDLPLSALGIPGWLNAIVGRRQRREAQEREDRRVQASESLAMYEAIVLGMERRREVFDVVEASSDPDDATVGLQRLLNVSEVHARAVLDTQLRRFTTRDRERLVEERDRIRTLLGSTDLD